MPAKDYPEGALRPIYLLTSNYPRQVRNDRGKTWSTENLEDGKPLDALVLDSNGEEVVDVAVDGKRIHGNHRSNTSLVESWKAMKDKTIIGYIPQVRHTHAIIEGMYGIMNEVSVDYTAFP